MRPRTKSTANSSLTWFKSNYSGAEGGDCGEVATSPQTIQVWVDRQDWRAGTLAVRLTARLAGAGGVTV
ncbi:DUF397 domain-containing protein [Streptomyces mirabilis]|uniref:DUF397 domain-containing protein n=1 Tax=Streptomyces mirabilis TaxID=68239 RepID=UPI003713C3D0